MEGGEALFLRIKRHILISFISVAFIFGLLSGHWGISFDWRVILALAAISIMSWRSRLGIPLLLITVIVMGVGRANSSDFEHSHIRNLYGQKVNLSGTVLDDPSIGDSGFVTFSLGQLKLDDRKIPGAVRITGPNYKVHRGYKVEASGKIQPTLGVAEGSMFATIKIISDQQNFVEKWRQRFIAGVRNSLPAPYSNFGLGLLLGSRSLLPKDLQSQLTAVGLSHLVAVSGYNLTILANFAHHPLRKVSKFLATSFTCWLILLFLIVSGFSASIVRAAIIAILVLFAGYFGRKPHPMTLIGLAAIATTAWRPEWLWADLGWQLSFLAFFGILVVAPIIRKRWIGDSALAGLVSESISAWWLTMPLLALRFGRLSVIGVLANLVVLPVVPLMMAMSLIAGLAGMFATAYAGWFSWPAMWILGAVLEGIGWLSRLPGSKWSVGLSAMSVILIYATTLCVIGIAYRKLAQGSEATV